MAPSGRGSPVRASHSSPRAVGDPFEVAVAEDEAPLVDKHPRVVVAAFDGGSDFGEEHGRAFHDLGMEQPQEGVGRGVQARHGNVPQGRAVAAAPYEQGAVAASERRAAVEHFVAVGDFGQQGAADLAHVGARTGCGVAQGAVQLLDVVECGGERQPFAVDAAAEQRIEHKGVVGTGGDG